MTTPLHITALQVTDFKRIEAIAIQPDGRHLILTGDNEAGKSSVLDSILTALNNTGADAPIKAGAKKARIKLSIGNTEQQYEIERVITQGGMRLVITDTEGKQVPQAQTFLKALTGSLALDPVALMEDTPANQTKRLKDMLGLTGAMAEIDQKLKQAEEDRTVQNRVVKTTKGSLEGLPAVPPGTPAEPVDVADLSERLEKGNEWLREASGAQEYKARIQAKIDDLDSKMAEQEAIIHTAKQEIERLRGLRKNEFEAQTLVEVKIGSAYSEKNVAQAHSQIAAIRSQIQSASEINQHVANAKRRKELAAQLVREERQADSLQDAVDALREQKVRLVRDAKLPVDGLELTEGGLVYDGIPLHDCNTATKIRVCCALAMAEKPDLRLIFIREGALLNTQNRQMILDIASEHDCQVLMEIFSEQPKGIENEIHIVEGRVA